jgi:2-polyprenyl-3-methyl-5-hydroxy-6-metoxy-1,4-benzoquinol methylase
MGETFEYVGGELEIFARATHWKRYFGSQLRPAIRGDVLEVGAGIGATAQALGSSAVRSWTALEPDSRMGEDLERALQACSARHGFSALRAHGTIRSLEARPRFDAILYIDVLEHIEDDRGELEQAARRLRPGGRLCVLSPALAWLFSEFDTRVGHHRRYDRVTLAGLTPPGTRLRLLRYLDCVGLGASLANRFLLRSPMPTHSQIGFWDRVMVPLSRPLDWLLRYRVGRSILVVWEREGESGSRRT